MLTTRTLKKRAEELNCVVLTTKTTHHAKNTKLTLVLHYSNSDEVVQSVINDMIQYNVQVNKTSVGTLLTITVSN